MGCGASSVEDIKTNNHQDKPEDLSTVIKSLCKIETSKGVCSGFLIRLIKKGRDFFCLMTTEENVNKKMIEETDNEYIKFYYDNESKQGEISLNDDDRYIKDFKLDKIDITVIEILPTDRIEKEYFLSPMIITEELKNMKNKEIVIIQNQKDNFSYLNGKIKEINKYEFTHTIKTEAVLTGSPIFIKNNKKVIGIKKNNETNSSQNYGDFLSPIINFFINYEKYENYELLYFLIKGFDYELQETNNYINEENYTNGKKEEGKIKYENGNYYIGEEKDNKREGKGILYYKNGNIKYDGNWKEDLPEGNGKYIDKDGKYYIGEFKKGLKKGKGIDYDKNDKIIYEGDFINGKKEGNGKYNFKTTYYFIGQFKNDKREGKGILYYNNGDIRYDGDFVNDKAEGNGKIIYEGGNYYIGQFKYNLKHGKGIYYKKNGDIIYEGDFLDGGAEGNGRFNYEDGNYCIGQFKDGKIDGKGKFYNQKGDIIYEGDLEKVFMREMEDIIWKMVNIL